jgi:bifunctional oligoribonuclease and PAP phosphatase NrnA
MSWMTDDWQHKPGELVKIDRIFQTIQEHDSFLLASHVDPDGDTLGSALALAFALDRLGKKVSCYSQGPIPEELDFLPGLERVSTEYPADQNFSCTIAIDCPALSRFGDELVKRGDTLGYLIKIDHHPGGDLFGRINLVDTSRAATGELIYEIIKSLGLAFDSDMAINLWTAIATDTGFFRYSNTSHDAMRIAGEMIDHGASPYDSAVAIYESESVERLRLIQRTLETLDVTTDGRFGSVVITLNTLKETGAHPTMTDRLVDYPRRLKGVEVAASIKERAPGSWRVSLRSKGAIDVAAVCRQFDGGGHAKAAGCSMEGSLEEVRSKLTEAVEQAILSTLQAE